MGRNIGTMNRISNNTDKSRYELTEEGKLAFAEYHVRDGVLVIPHVEADPALRGKGAAGRLMEGVVAEARREGLKIAPVCGYAAAYLQRHPEHSDLLA